MFTLMLNVRSAGRVIPYFTNLCISLRPLLMVLPILAAAYCLWLWFQKAENASQWRGFMVTAMTVLRLVCVSSDGDILLARHRPGQDSDRDPVSSMPPHITKPGHGHVAGRRTGQMRAIATQRRG